MPTVLGLMGYEKPYFAFGRDVFNEPERRPMVLNCVNQTYQALTDSLSLYFDGDQCLYAFSADDTLQEYDILNLNNVAQRSLEHDMKVRLQSYYSHVRKGELKAK
jgi:hypothetical protein